MQRQAVLDEATSWLLTPYHPQGCVRGAGASCGGLLLSVYQSAGLPIRPHLDWATWRQDWHCHTTEERLLDMLQCYLTPVETPSAGDTALFRLFGKRPYSHIGIVVAWPLIIHAPYRNPVEYLDVSRTALASRDVMFLSPWKSK